MGEVSSPHRGAVPDLNGLPVAFARVLRRSGIPVPVGATIAFARALAAVADRGAPGAYWAGRATLVRRPEDIKAYDRAFAVFFGDADPGLRVQSVPVVELLIDDAADDEMAADDDGEEPAPPAERQLVRWSPVEVLRAKDLARCTPEELDEAHRLMADLRLRAALRARRGVAVAIPARAPGTASISAARSPAPFAAPASSASRRRPGQASVGAGRSCCSTSRAP